MDVFEFELRHKPQFAGFTLDRSGANLPKTGHTEWHFVRSLTIPDNCPIGSMFDNVKNEINDKGYSVQETETKFRERIVKSIPK